MTINKKQKNRKIVAQNKRNRMVNRRYSSTIKTLSKLFSKTVTNLQKKSAITKIPLQNEPNLTSVANKLFSFLDKAVKKNVLHKNNSARKKSKINKILNKAC